MNLPFHSTTKVVTCFCLQLIKMNEKLEIVDQIETEMGEMREAFDPGSEPETFRETFRWIRKEDDCRET